MTNKIQLKIYLEYLAYASPDEMLYQSEIKGDPICQNSLNMKMMGFDENTETKIFLKGNKIWILILLFLLSQVDFQGDSMCHTQSGTSDCYSIPT